jgi:hypothetical protein
MNPFRAPFVRMSSARAALPRAVMRSLAALVLGGAFTILALPPFLNLVLPFVYPDVKVEKKILGFIPNSSTKSHPHVPIRKRQVLVIAWILTGGGALAIFVRNLSARSGDDEKTLVAERTSSNRPGPHIPPAPPEDRYVLEAELGRGGMGVVWIARDVVLERRVAVKELVVPSSSGSDFVARFRKEARALARLTHPNIVQVHDFLDAGDRFRMVIELAEGGSLADRLAKHGPLPAPEAARVAAEVARGLAFAHAEGVVHRDVKPANILFGRDGVSKIADFGLAKFVSDPGTTMSGSVLGSPKYLSPEQAAGVEADERSDVYSLGVTLYETLTGQPPFQGEVIALLSRHLYEEPAPLHEKNPTVPDSLAKLISAMMRKDPAARPALAQALAQLELEAKSGV